MQELLSKLIEMDERARALREEAEQEKAASEKNIDKLRRHIYDDYIERAKDRVEKNFAVDRRITEDELKTYREKIDAMKAQMNQQYEAEGDRWVDEIVARVLA
jgi:FKBP-type peptidyl-prolyl cis-trans isomerase (trigger factor)